VQIETVGRSRRRRHRGGTVEQDRARADRAAARAQLREPEPEPAAVAVAAPPAAPASDSISEGFGEASGELGDISDFGDFLRGAQVYANDPVSFQDDPTEAAKADVSSAREESQRSARESAVAAADEVQAGEDYLDMVVTELEGKPLSPEQWYSWRGRPTNRCRWPRAAGVRVTVLTQGYEQHDAPSHVPSSCI
jgi:hypothetical protein